MTKSKSGKKFMIILTAVIVVFLAAMFVLSNSAGKKEIAPRVATVKVAKGDVEEKLDTSGNVESQNQKTFFSPVNAKIATVGIEMGDTVKSGEKLVAFDLKDLEKQNKQADLNVRSSDLDIIDAVNTSNTAAGKQANAASNAYTLQQQVDAYEAYIQELKDLINEANADAQSQTTSNAKKASEKAAKEAKAQQKAIKAAYDAEMAQYKKDYTQYEKDVAEKLSKVTTCTTAYNTAETQYQQAFQRWNADQSEANQSALGLADTERSTKQEEVRKAEEEYNKALNSPPTKPADPDYSSINTSATTSGDMTVIADTMDLQSELEKASAELAELQGDLAQEEAIAKADVAGLSSESLEKMNIGSNLSELEAKSIEELIAEGKKGLSAEFNGVISNCIALEGAMVTQGMELFTLQSTEDVNVDISVAKSDYAKVKEGQKAVVTMGDNTYSGTITKVNKIAVPNEKGMPVIGAKVHIDNPDENIFIGVEAKVSIDTASARDVMVVPIEAVNIGNNGSFCYVIDNGEIVKRDVVTGISSGNHTEIKEGLNEGDEILEDIGTYTEGDKVTSAPETETQISATE